MKHIKKFYENKQVLKTKEEIKEIEELCVWIKDDVDSIKVEPNGILNGYQHYQIEVSLYREKSPIDKIVENAEKMLEITKEYTELLFKLEDMGYEVSYHLLEQTQHLNFYRFGGKIQVKKSIS